MTEGADDSTFLNGGKKKVDEYFVRIKEKATREITEWHIKSVVESFHVNADQAMDLLKIPAEDRDKYYRD